MGESVTNEATEAVDATAERRDRTAKRPGVAGGLDTREPNVDLSLAVIRTWMDQGNRRARRPSATSDPSAR